jgi:hypothetical protein
MCAVCTREHTPRPVNGGCVGCLQSNTKLLQPACQLMLPCLCLHSFSLANAGQARLDYRWTVLLPDGTPDTSGLFEARSPCCINHSGARKLMLS